MTSCHDDEGLPSNKSQKLPKVDQFKEVFCATGELIIHMRVTQTSAPLYITEQLVPSFQRFIRAPHFVGHATPDFLVFQVDGTFKKEIWKSNYFCFS